MKLILLSIFISTNAAYAGYIRPDISWSQTIINTTGAATAKTQKDNSVGLWLSKTDDENLSTKKSNESKTRYLTSFVSNEQGAAEILIGDSSRTYSDNSKDYSKTIMGNAGVNLDKLSIGVNGLHVNADGFNAYKIGLSGALELSNLISVGGGIDRTYINSSDFEYKTFYAGIAISQDQDYLFEAIYKHEPGTKKGVYSTSEDTDLIFSGVYHSGRTELKGIYSTSVEKDDRDNEEYSENLIEFEFEYKLSDKLFLGAISGRSIRDYDDFDSSSNNYKISKDTLGFKGRVKFNNISLEARIVTENTETDYSSSSDKKEESSSAQLYGAYFF
jgi:hypothetical protein